MSRRSNIANPYALTALACVLMLGFVFAPYASAQRTQLKPGRNFFSPQQDVELGQQVAQQAEQKYPMLNDQRVDQYLDRLGKRLAGYAPGEKFPYQFRCVDDPTINAFALPGGFIYIHRGAIEAADDESELSGVIAHEIGHVALRHSTNLATKAYLYQVPLSILGGVLGEKTKAAMFTQLAAGFTINSVLLKYSRDDERQADIIGTQILYDSNYDPSAMARFFEKLGTRGSGTDFFSSHPNPENRIQKISEEIGRLGPVSARAISNSSEFRNIQRLLKSLPAAGKAITSQTQTSSPGTYSRPARPSSQTKYYNDGYVSLRYPGNWKAYGNQQDFTLAPDGGIISEGNDAALVYGMTTATYAPSGGINVGLREATNRVIRGLQSQNPNMRVTKEQGQIRLGNRSALWILLSNDSPIGGRENLWLVSVLQSKGLVYYVFVTPEQDFSDYQEAFRQIINSINFIKQ